jgi:hypothetical protein
MWLVMLLLFASPQSLPTTTKSPSLIVQLVDPNWDPLPGAEVTVKPLSARKESLVVHTDNDGYAKFSIEDDKDYAIEAKLPGFKTKRLEHMHLFKRAATTPTAYVQFQLQLSGPMTTVY